MEKLPTELVSMIFDQLDSVDNDNPERRFRINGFSVILTDTFSLRLVSKKFAAVGAEKIVKKVHLSFRKQSFEKLENISKDPVLRQFVEIIEYESDVLSRLSRKAWERCIPLSDDIAVPPYAIEPNMDNWYDSSDDGTSLNNYIKAKDEWRCKHGPRMLYTEKELSRAYKCFRKEVQDIQTQVLSTNLDYTTLAETFSRFPKLREIYNLVGRERYSPDLTTAFKHTLVSPSQFNQDSKQKRTGIGFRQIESILLAVPSAANLKTLVCHGVDWDLFSDQGILPSTKVPSMLYLPTFSRLTRLELTINDARPITMSDQTALDARSALLGKALSAAKGLTSLALNFSGRRRTRGDWDKIALDTTWAHLKNLEIFSIATTETFWDEFFRRHSKTLVSLELCAPTLLKGTWTSTFSKMKAAIEETNMLKIIKLPSHLYCVEDTNSSGSGSTITSMYYENSGITLHSKLENYLFHDGEDPAIFLATNSYKNAVSPCSIDWWDEPDDWYDSDSSDDSYESNESDESESPDPQHSQDSQDSRELDLLADYSLQTNESYESDDFTNFADFGGADDSDDPDQQYYYYNHYTLPSAQGA